MMELLLTIAAIATLLMGRNFLVFHIRMKAMRIIDAENHKRLGTNLPLLDYPILREMRGTGPSYDAMLFDLRRWTLTQFYPDVAELSKPRT